MESVDPSASRSVEPASGPKGAQSRGSGMSNVSVMSGARDR